MNYKELFDFESALAEYTGAPYVVVTDGATSAIELCLRYDKISTCEFTPFTYISIPMLMHRLQINYNYTDESHQTWTGEYQFIGTRVWDSARRLEKGMYRKGQMQCLSFGNGKPLQLGRAGAILLDDRSAYEMISMMRCDGRDLRVSPWVKQKNFLVGYHYHATLESCQLGIKKLPTVNEVPKFVSYPDCRQITIVG